MIVLGPNCSVIKNGESERHINGIASNVTIVWQTINRLTVLSIEDIKAD